ncbi:MAG TPA: TfoX/Sxy family protein [Clostridia bacterium]
MGELSKLPNIGATCEKRLALVGIDNIETLKKAGSKEAFIKLFMHEGDTCLCTLYALEGAIQSMRWHNLPQETKDDLKKFFNKITNGDEKNEI